MSDFLDQAKDYIKDIPVWAWGLGGAGVLVLVAITKSRPTLQAVPSVASVSDGEQNTAGDKISESQLANKMTELVNSFEGKLGEQRDFYESELKNAEEGNAERLESLNEAWQEKVNGLTSSYSERISSVSSQLDSVSDYAKRTVKEANDRVKEIEKQTKSSPDWTIGKGGTSDARIIKENQDRLKNDSGFKSSEIDRAKSVIEYRESKGLDTSLQEKYLKGLTG